MPGKFHFIPDTDGLSISLIAGGRCHFHPLMVLGLKMIKGKLTEEKHANITQVSHGIGVFITKKTWEAEESNIYILNWTNTSKLTVLSTCPVQNSLAFFFFFLLIPSAAARAFFAWEFHLLHCKPCKKMSSSHY